MSHFDAANNRRHFLKKVSALGAATIAPPLLLAGCLGDDDEDPPIPTRGPREAQDLHFDLSSSGVSSPRLYALRSDHHGRLLHRHDAASRARLRASNPLLQAVPDDKLTHFLEGVDLPAGALQGVLVMGKRRGTNDDVLAAAHVQVPSGARAEVARRATMAKQGALSGKRQAYRIPQAAASDPLPDGINNFSTPWDTACYLVFHHPEVMNLNPALGAEILSRIETYPCDPVSAGNGSCATLVGDLAGAIALRLEQAGYPSTTPGSWCTLVPLSQADGSPVVDADGNPQYRYDLDDDIAHRTQDVVRALLKNIFNDPLFKGSNWQSSPSLASAAATGAATTATTAAESDFQVTATSAIGTALSGIHFSALTADASTRNVVLTVKNAYLRFLSVYVQYFDANGNKVQSTNPSSLDSDRASYLTVIGSNDQLMGIPFQGNDVESSDVVFTMPTAASSATVMFGSLGLGGDPFTKEAVTGSSLTLALNIGIPGILLATGTYADLKAGWEGLLKDETLLTAFVQATVKAIGSSDVGGGIYTSATSQSAEPALLTLANVVLQMLLEFAPTLAFEIGFKVSSSNLIVASLGPLGMAFKLLSVAATLAEIIVTVSQIFSSTAITTNSITFKKDTVVRVARDPRDFQFPAAARKVRVDAHYDGGATPMWKEIDIAQGQVDPVDVKLEGVPDGGKVVFTVSLHSNDGCLVGSAKTDTLSNVGTETSLVEIAIVELVAPLKADTVHVHSLKLTYADSQHGWTAAAAPQQTQANLCNGSDDAICALSSLSVHTASGMAGYSYLAGGPGMTACDTGAAGTVYTAHNIFLGTEPDRGLKQMSCGYTQPVGVVYDPLGAAVGGHHFFVQPAADGFHLRSVTLDTATPFDLGQTLSWGRFSNAPDSLTVLPSGFVVGVNRTNHKMEVLLLPAAAVDQAFEPTAVPFASIKAGLGTRPGLMDTPVAVATSRGAVLVLEQGNARVQALSVSADPVLLFDGATTNLMPLRVEAGAVYLDLAVEGQGYLYVLSYVNSGLQAENYRLDVYTPNGDFLNRTTGVAAARIAVDLFRNVYTLNFETLTGSPRIEPSLSQWLPRSPTACLTTLPAAGRTGREALSFGCGAPTSA